MEFFKDYDKHNHGLVTSNQFLAGVGLSKLPLEKSESQILLERYQHADGLIAYREFCFSIDSVFTQNDLEGNPLAIVNAPNIDWLVERSNKLSEVEEIQFNRVLGELKTIIKQRRLLLTPFFKDFDKRFGNMGRVTRSHFSRLLATMNLNISEDDLYILLKKYSDRHEGKVNYKEFIKDVDSDGFLI